MVAKAEAIEGSAKLREVGFDCESLMGIERGKASLQRVPKNVCGQFFEEGYEPLVLGRLETAKTIRRLLLADNIMIVGHSITYDMLQAYRVCKEELDTDILPLIFAKYEKGLIRDTMIRAQLRDIERGGTLPGYGLGLLVAKELGVKVDGKYGSDNWRKNYGLLISTPIEYWPADAYDYAALDPKYTLELFHKLPAHPNEGFQCAADWCLALMTSWGVMIDPDHCADMYEFYKASYDKAAAEMEAGGYIEGGTLKREKKAELIQHAFEVFGERPWLTKGGLKLEKEGKLPSPIPASLVTTDKKVIQYIEERVEEDPALEDAASPMFRVFMKFNRAEKMLSAYLQPMLDAYEGPMCFRADCLKDTGRISTSNPNVQAFPSRLNIEEIERKAKDPDAVVAPYLRQCIVPRPGTKFVSADYQAIEMVALAQYMASALGYITPLGKAINEGMDLHNFVAAHALKISIEEADAFKKIADDPGQPNTPEVENFIRWRNLAKVANFSFPTGAMAATFVAQARAQGIKVTLDIAEYIREVWFEAWSGIKEFGKYIERCKDYETGMYHVPQLGPSGPNTSEKARLTNWWRTRVVKRRTQAANTPFQGLAADGAKWAMWLITKACYLKSEGSVLFGSHLVLFVHDEFVLECPEDKAQECAAELSRLMVLGMSKFCNLIKVVAKPEVLPGGWQK